MAFFLIVPSVMIVAILLVHGAANHFGLQLKYKSLALCALAAIAITFITVRTSPFIDKTFFIKIGALIIISATMITVLNRFLIRRETVDKNDGVPNVETIDESEEVAAPSMPSNEVDDFNRRVAEIKASKKTVGEPTQSKSLVKLINDDKKQAASIKSSKQSDQSDQSAPPKPSTLSKTAPQSKPAAKSEHVAQPPPPKPKTFEQSKQLIQSLNIKPHSKPSKNIDQRAANDRRTVEKKAADLATANEKLSSVIEKIKTDSPVEKFSKGAATEPNLTDDERREVDEHLHSLDDILDFAYAQKNAGNFKLAIYTYQKALEHYRADDYAPFIAIDLSSIYKEQAAYSKAIKVCEDALTLPAVMRNASARKEFSTSLAYLRTVQSVLSKHRVLSTPFSKISRQLLAEIDADFKKLTILS